MKWSSWLKRQRWERQMHAEFQFHLENQVSDYMQQGLTREDAELRARRDFGALELAKDECRDQRAFEPLDRFLRDLRYASRSLRKTPAYAAAAILTLGLGHRSKYRDLQRARRRGPEAAAVSRTGPPGNRGALQSESQIPHRSFLSRLSRLAARCTLLRANCRVRALSALT